MATMTLQQIADLAGVRRPVVSAWVTRYADSEHPFPPPTSQTMAGARGQAMKLFDADQVAQWLRITGRGNNSDAAMEIAAQSSEGRMLAERSDDASALLLVHSVLGEPLTGLAPDDVALRLVGVEAGGFLDADDLPRLLGDTDLVEVVDRVADALFTADRVLDRMVGDFLAADGAWRELALTGQGALLLGRVLQELHGLGGRVVVPHGPGGHVLAGLLLRGPEEDEQLCFGVTGGEQPMTTQERAAWRRLQARGSRCAHLQEAGGNAAALHLAHWQRVPDPERFFDEVDDLVLGLGDEDAAVILGPAELLLQDSPPAGSRAWRDRILRTHESDDGPRLRYAARLPYGLCRFGGRRRLGLWVLGPATPHLDRTWSVYGEHGSTGITEATAQAIAADAAVALSGGGALAQHEFLSSARRVTEAYLRGSSLMLEPSTQELVAGGELLARVWAHDHGVLGPDVRVAATQEWESPAPVAWRQAMRTLARDLPGTRVPPEIIGEPGVGTASVIGPEELRDPGRIGTRAVARLQLETVVPRAKYTRPGDVVYVASGGAAAWVDEEGGHVVMAPARTVRIRPDAAGSRALDRHLVAVDIRAARGTDRRVWRLRTVAGEQRELVAVAGQRLHARRGELEAAMHELEELERVLAVGVTSGALRLEKEN